MKKLTVVLVGVLLLTLAMGASPVLARGRGGRVTGDIVALDPATGVITMQPRYGDAVTVQTSADTEFYRKVRHGGLEPITFDDLAVGDQAKVQGTWDGEILNARKVIVMPPPPPPPESMVQGSITALDAATDIITVQPRYGDPVTVQTSADTQLYRVVRHGGLEPITFDELAVGDQVKVWGAWDDGSFNADKVIVMPSTPPPPESMVQGSIIALDAATGSITVQPRYGDPVTVQTSDGTEFYRAVRHGDLQPITFDGLMVGDRVVVWGTWDGGTFNASKVVVMGGGGGGSSGSAAMALPTRP